MEHRRENRIPIEQSVWITVLSDPEKRFAATVKNATDRGLGLISPDPVKFGAAVKIEFADSIFLGEVMHCRTDEHGYFLGIELTEVLSGLAALSRMAQEFNEQLDPETSRRR